MLSSSAWRLASMMLSCTPTVPHSSLPSVDSIRTRVRAPVPQWNQVFEPYNPRVGLFLAAGKTCIKARRKARSSAFTGPSPSAMVCSVYAVHLHFHAGLADGNCAVAPHRNMITLYFEGRFLVLQDTCGSATPANLRPLQTRNPRLESFDFGQDVLSFRSIMFELEPEFGAPS